MGDCSERFELMHHKNRFMKFSKMNFLEVWGKKSGKINVWGLVHRPHIA